MCLKIFETKDIYNEHVIMKLQDLDRALHDCVKCKSPLSSRIQYLDSQIVW